MTLVTDDVLCLAKKEGELEEYNKSQATIIQKLREECGLLVKRLEEVTHKYKLVSVSTQPSSQLGSRFC